MNSTEIDTSFDAWTAATFKRDVAARICAWHVSEGYFDTATKYATTYIEQSAIADAIMSSWATATNGE